MLRRNFITSALASVGLITLPTSALATIALPEAKPGERLLYRLVDFDRKGSGKWEHIQFEELKENDYFRLIEHDPVQSQIFEDGKIIYQATSEVSFTGHDGPFIDTKMAWFWNASLNTWIFVEGVV